jgi:hypothetical protein
MSTSSRASGHSLLLPNRRARLLKSWTSPGVGADPLKHGEKVAPVMAALTGLATIACCLAIGFAAAVVTASLRIAVAAY